jgi:PPOX class probable F420-dependent enzyme
MEQKIKEFLEKNHKAVQTTLKPNGTPHVARVGVGLVEGKLWGSSTKTRARHKYVVRDPRSTLCVLGEDGYTWLGIESRVTVLDGPDAPELNLKLYRYLAGEPDDVDEYLEAMVKEQRVIYEFSIEKTYGL